MYLRIRKKIEIILLVLFLALFFGQSTLAKENYFQPAIGKIVESSVGAERVVVREDGGLEVYSTEGGLLTGFPVFAENNVFVSSPVLADVNGDGWQEIVVVGRTASDAYSVFVYTGTGTVLASAELTGKTVYYDPVVLPLPGLVRQAILIATNDGKIIKYELSGSNLNAVNIINETQELAITVSEDGSKIYVVFPKLNTLKIYQRNSSVWQLKKTLTLDKAIVYPLVLDKENNFFGVTSEGKLVSLDIDTGNTKTGFPVSFDKMPVSSPVLTDIDNNSSEELVVLLSDGSRVAVDKQGNILQNNIKSKSFLDQSADSKETGGGLFSSIGIFGKTIVNSVMSILNSIYGNIKLIFNSESGTVIPFTPFTPLSLNINSTASPSWGASWADYNNDGKQDLFIINAENNYNYLYKNNGDKTFTKITDSGLTNGYGLMLGSSAVWADYDNDGDLDVYVPAYYGKDGLFKNNGNGTFSRMPSITDNTVKSYGASWGDYDKDGFVDLAVANIQGPNLLFHNNKDGTFGKVNNSPLSSDIGKSFSIYFVDLDNDSSLDIFVANGARESTVFKNNGNGAFTKLNTFTYAKNKVFVGASFADYDNDGDSDIFMSNFYASNELYINDSKANFTLAANTGILTSSNSSSGSNAIDYDNDGCTDIFVVNSKGVNNVLYHGSCNNTFSTVSDSSIVSDVSESYTGTWADYDNDGDLDPFVVNHKQNSFFYNNNSTNNWLKIKLVGTDSNKAGIGAKVTVKATIDGQVVTQTKQVLTQTGYRNQDSLDLVFGLKKSATVDEIKVDWLNGNTSQMSNVAINQLLTITETPQNTPKINVKADEKTVVNNGSVDFGNNFVDTNKQISFKIENLGFSDLNFVDSGSGVVNITGPDKDMFEIVNFPSAPIASQANFVMNIKFKPTSSGNKTAVLNIFTNDVLNNPYIINFIGNTEIQPFSSSFIPLGISTSTLPSWGVSWADYGNDGKIDLMITNAENRTNYLYYNKGDKTFIRLINVTEMVKNNISASMSTWADYDNDGWLDAYVPAYYGKSSLYHKDGAKAYYEIKTGELYDDNTLSYGASFADYDNDGYVDLIKTNISGTNVLFHNNKDGTFTKIIDPAISADTGKSWSPSFADMDNDGDLDLFVANMGRTMSVFKNNGDGTFAVLSNALVNAPANKTTVGSSFGDYDNDGDFDLLLANYGSTASLFNNNGAGIFTYQPNSGLATTSVVWTLSSSFVDYDNDGYLDIFLSNSKGQNNSLYHNNKNGTFAEIKNISIVSDGGESQSAGWGDYDNDGDLDVLVANYNQLPFFYENKSTNNWIKVNLKGTEANKSSIGAKVKVKYTINGQTITQLKQVSSASGYRAMDSQQLVFGLKDASKIDEITVDWGKGVGYTATNIGVNQVLNITQGN